MEDSTPGPDGFLLSRSDPLHAAHLLLNDYLVAEERRELARTPPDDAVWQKLPKRQIIAQIEAVVRRLASLLPGHLHAPPPPLPIGW